MKNLHLRLPELGGLAVLYSYLFLGFSLQAQSTYIVKGKIIDAETGEGVPFANVYPLQKSTLGTTSDFDGYYTLRLASLDDSLVASYVGYVKKAKPMNPEALQGSVLIVNFQLSPESRNLKEVVFKAGEDPSYPIMRKVLKAKKNNDKRALDSYENESYVKIEFDLDQVSERFGKRKIVGKITEAIDSAGGLTGEDGNPLIPLFLSETLSRFYYQSNPERTKENILKTKIEGVGLDNDSPISQLIGSSFQEYNFYKNWMLILRKNVVSPLADGWKLYYDYFLEDSVQIGPHFCYKIEVVPKRKEELAFDGYIWIDSESYALKQVDLKIGNAANINFVEKLKIQQEYKETNLGPWVPNKTRVLIDIAELSKKSAGVLIKFYVSNQDYAFNKNYPLKFFRDEIELDPLVYESDADFWAQNRHDSLSPEEIKTYSLINTIKEVPVVKTYTEILKVLALGYYTVGPIDFGNYLYTYAFNDIEGHRLRLGMRTNTKFSNKIELKGYAAYGLRDNAWKYSGQLRFIPSRKRWTELGVSYSKDIFQTAANPDGVVAPSAYLAFLNFYQVSERGPFMREAREIYFQRDLFKGVRFRVDFKNNRYSQIGQHFAFLRNPGEVESAIERNMVSSEVSMEARFSKGERFFIRGNNRVSVGTDKFPVVTLRYTRGLNDVWNGEFSYHKFEVSLEQRIRLGLIGNTYYLLNGFYTPSTLPYPLLKVYLANEGFFYNFYGANLMDYLEFIGDRHVQLNFIHDFDGFFFNKIPLFKKLKWRLFANGNILVSDLGRRQVDLIPEQDGQGNTIMRPRGVGREPYIEIGYGISNILRFIRVNAMHRLTYRNQPGDIGRNFGVFVSALFEL